MPRNTLFDLMRALRADEIKDAKAFVKKEKPEYLACFKTLCKAHPKMPEEAMDNERLFAAAFGPQPFDEQKLRHLKVQLCRLIEGYLVHTELKSDEKTRSELLVRALSGRGDPKAFSDSVFKRMKTLEESPLRGKDYFQEMAHHFRLLYFHPMTEQMDEGGDFLRQYIENAVAHFTTALLETGAEYLLGLRNTKNTSLPPETERMFDQASRYPQEHEVPRYFQQLYRLYRADEHADELYALNDQLGQGLARMDETEKRMAAKLLANYPIPEANRGSLWHTRFIFEVYKNAVDKGLLLDLNMQADPGHFTNIVIVAAKVGEFEWAKALVANHAQYLPDNFRDPVSRLCLGSVHYQQGHGSKDAAHYKKALQYLGADPLRIHERFNIRYRSLTVRVCYELVALEKSHYADFEKNVKNFERYLRKNDKFKTNIKNGYLGFLRHAKTLARLAISPGTCQADIRRYAEVLKNDKEPALRHWLEEKAEELLQPLRP